MSFLLVLAFAPRVFAEVKVTTQPSQVTVFPDSARIVREGSLKMKGGLQHVVFPGLPASVIESSLRLTAEGPQGTKLYGVGLKKEFTEEVVEERTRLLKNRLQVFEDQKIDLTDRIEANKTEIEILKGLAKEGTGTATKEGPTHPGTIKDFTLSAGAVGRRIAKLLASSRLEERGIRSLGLKIEALNNEISEGSAPAREKRTAEADIELPQAGTARFTLTYQVEGASWAPLYDLRLETESEKPQMNLAFNAGVRQNTGEDWKNVSLVLSTARPTEGTQVPDPTDWWLDFFNAQVRSLKRKMATLTQTASTKDGATLGYVYNKNSDVQEEQESNAPVPAEPEVAKTVRSEYAMSFNIPTKRDIPSDGTDHRVGIAQNNHPVKLTLVAVPRLSEAAYLEAKVTYGGEQTLLPGTAQLYRDGDFVGTTEIEAKAPGESFDLGFGQDDQIHVERKAMKDEEGKSGGIFDINKGERRYRWVTTIANYHVGTRTIEVREQMPHSRQEKIEVSEGEFKPKLVAEDASKPGLKIWKMVLGPKEKTKIDFAYNVKFPEGTQVSGLE